MATKTVDVVNGEISTGKVTLVANTADTVTFTALVTEVEIVSDGTDDLYVRKDGGAALVTGKFSEVLPGGSKSVRTIKVQPGHLSISLISAGATSYWVTKVG